MIEKRLSLTICTDNRLVSHTTVCREIEKTVEAFSLTPHDFKDMIIYGFKRSFLGLPYAKKREYVRRVIEYYETIERKFDVSS